MRNFIRFTLLIGSLAVAAYCADISGKWVFQVETGAGSGSPNFTFEQQGEALTGTYSGLLGQAKLKGTVKGTQVEFTFDVEGDAGKATVEYKGTVESDTKMKGTVKLGSFGDGTWTGTKQ